MLIEIPKELIKTHLFEKMYIERILKNFCMNKAYRLTSQMTIRLLDMKKDHFHPPKEHEEFLSPEISYLSIFGTITYLVNYTRSDISFSVKLLARYSSALTRMRSLIYGKYYSDEKVIQ